MPAQSDKSDTLKVRMDAATLRLMETARAYVKLDKSKFIRESVREKARTVIAERQRTVFSAEDWTLFFEMLERPPEPTERMKRAGQTLRDIEG